MDSTTSTIMEYEISQLNKKVNKLEATIKRLEKENSLLSNKIINLEDIILKISSQLNINFQSSSFALKNEIKSSANEETWMYYIPADKKIKNDAIKKKLNFDAEDLTFIEVQADWKNDKDMLGRVLKNFESFNEFAKDFQSMSLENLIEVFEQIFEIALMSDIIIVIRSIPSSKDKKKANESIIASIGKIAGIMYKSFSKLSGTNESIGKMALVLESVDDLNIINTSNGDSRILLSVEKL